MTSMRPNLLFPPINRSVRVISCQMIHCWFKSYLGRFGNLDTIGLWYPLYVVMKWCQIVNEPWILALEKWIYITTLYQLMEKSMIFWGIVYWVEYHSPRVTLKHWATVAGAIRAFQFLLSGDLYSHWEVSRSGTWT